MRPRIGIVGAGPVGGILGAHLAKHNQDIILVDLLRAHLNEIRNNGLKLKGIADIDVRIEEVRYSIAELEPDKVDLLFLAVKASALNGAIAELKKVFQDMRTDPKFISIQNGLDTEELIGEAFGAENTLRVVVNYAGNLIGNGRIKMTFFNKPNYIGSISRKAYNVAREVAELMTAAGLETEFAEDIKRYEWEKTILNSALMPVSAITGMTMKQVMEFPQTRKLVEEALRECIAVAESVGYELGDFFSHGISYFEKAGHHKPSMLADLEGGRPTEIDFLNGKIVYYGKKYGAATPYNEALTNLVKALELMSQQKET